MKPVTINNESLGFIERTCLFSLAMIVSVLALV